MMFYARVISLEAEDQTWIQHSLNSVITTCCLEQSVLFHWIMNHYSWTFAAATAAVQMQRPAHALDNLQLIFLFDFTLIFCRSPSGLQVPQVLSRQALHHRLLPQASRFFAEEVWESVVKKKKERKKKEKKSPPLPLCLRRGMCLHFCL